MKVSLAIQDNQTGELHCFSDSWDWESFDAAQYWWTDGNGGCDCNRGVTLYGINYGCGDEERFSLKKLVPI